MGEAMAGVMKSGRHAQAWPDKNEKSDHFVGCCYAEYVAAGRSFNGNGQSKRRWFRCPRGLADA